MNNGNIFERIVYFRNFLKKKKVKIIHFHGVWDPEYLIYLYLCKIKNISTYIHPHGMLLKEALFNKGLFHYIKKFIYISFILKFLITKKTIFLSMTKRETKSIKFFFKSNNVHLVNNFISEKNFLKQNLNKSNTFICLARINKHKNLHQLIQSFSRLNLHKKWKLVIYGIEDDNDYYIFLKKIIKFLKIQKNIKIKKPIFGKLKKKIINKSWCNILISKSEVISQSVLESANNYLPSIISKNILEPGWVENGCLSCNNLDHGLDKAIINATKWNLKQRISRGYQINKFTKKNYNEQKTLLRLNKIYTDFCK